MPNCVGTPIPTGGAISLAITASGSGMTLSRSQGASGGPYTQIYSGVPTPLYIDCGDGLTTPLASGFTYFYQVNDADGLFTSAGIPADTTLDIQMEPLTAMLIKLLQGGFNNLAIPNGVTPGIMVLQAMPLGGIPPMPFVVVNMDLFQQQETPIGQDVEQLQVDGTWTITNFSKQIFRISVLAQNSADRDFYRDGTAAIFQALMRTVFGPMGQDVRHNFQISSGQVANDLVGNSPGFYYADVLAEFSGTMNISITPAYGLMRTIDFTANLTNGSNSAVSVSVSG